MGTPLAGAIHQMGYSAAWHILPPGRGLALEQEQQLKAFSLFHRLACNRTNVKAGTVNRQVLYLHRMVKFL